MQNKIHIIQGSHHPVPNSQPVPKQQLQNLELTDFVNFVGLSRKANFMEKFELPEKRTDTKEELLPLGSPPYII